MKNYCDKTIPKILVGNKDDKNITEVFNEIARLTIERYLRNSLDKVSSIRIEQSQTIGNVTNKKVLYRIKYKI
jgi:hypothetical protein